MKKRICKISIIAGTVFLACAVLFFALVWNGVIILNGIYAENYDIKGIDVSSYQGEIDWQILASQDISFVFIKATEGSSFVDKNFDYNFTQAQKTSLAVGAYHFFSYDSEGKTQAENFINTVVPFDGMLPPVIDLEFYGDKESNPPDRADVEMQLKTMLDMLEAHYGQKPIIYATEKSYKLYLSDDYEEYDIWIRNVISPPKLSDNRAWTFWQYTNRDILDGYNGEEKFIDVNVFNGSLEEYSSYLESNADIDDANNLARSFIYVKISVINDKAFAESVLDSVRAVVPWYVEANMTVPSDYSGTNCQKITVMEEIHLTNPGYTTNQAIKYAVLFAFAACAVTCVIIIIVDRSDKRLRDYETVMRNLEVPVLGVIPTIEPMVQKAKAAAKGKTSK